MTSGRAQCLQMDGGRSTSPGLPFTHAGYFFFCFSPFGLHMYSGVTSAVILRNPTMEKSNLILHFLKSNGRHILAFLKESIHAKGETWASSSKNGDAGAGSRRRLDIKRVTLLSLGRPQRQHVCSFTSGHIVREVE